MNINNVKKKKKKEEADQSNFCLIWLQEYHFVQLEELRMIICIRDVSLLNQPWASVRQLAGGALIGLKAHLVWFILNILCALWPLWCKRKDIKSLSFYLSQPPAHCFHFHLLFFPFVSAAILYSAVSILYWVAVCGPLFQNSAVGLQIAESFSGMVPSK